jgi:hypothetical protein
MAKFKPSDLKTASMFELVTRYYFKAPPKSSFHFALEAEIRSRTKGPLPEIGDINWIEETVTVEVNPNGEYIR